MKHRENPSSKESRGYVNKLINQTVEDLSWQDDTGLAYIIIHLFTYLKEGLICFFHSIFTLFMNSCTLYCLPKKIGYPAVLISGIFEFACIG